MFRTPAPAGRRRRSGHGPSGPVPVDKSPDVRSGSVHIRDREKRKRKKALGAFDFFSRAFSPLARLGALALYAGQSSGLTEKVRPAAAVLEELVAETEARIDHLSGRVV